MTEKIRELPVLPEPVWSKPIDVCNEGKSVIESLKKTAFVLGTALICFAAARNTITWHFEHLWGASGDFWQSRWQWVHSLFGGNEAALIILGTTIWTFGIFWFVNIIFLFIDITGKPQLALKYKIPDGQHRPVDRKKLIHTIKVVLFNQLVVGLGATITIINPLYQWRGCSSDDELPSFRWVLFEITCCILILEFVFYYSHRLFHHPKLYKRFHKQHHEWTAPIGIVSLYSHPLEYLITALGPTILGPLIMGSHIATAWLWFGIALTNTSISHSSYHFPFLPSPEAHDIHHVKFNQNYGVLGVLDRLHGTD